MTGLSAVRTISHGVERLAWRVGSGGNRPTDGRIKAAAWGPIGRLRTVGRSAPWRDVRYYAIAWTSKNPKEYQPPLHIAYWQHHDS
jgi:hypothetical protein